MSDVTQPGGGGAAAGLRRRPDPDSRARVGRRATSTSGTAMPSRSTTSCRSAANASGAHPTSDRRLAGQPDGLLAERRAVHRRQRHAAQQHRRRRRRRSAQPDLLWRARRTRPSTGGSTPPASSARTSNTIGNAGRNNLYGPPQRRTGRVGVQGRACSAAPRLQLRLEVFNVTNTPSFAVPDGALGAATFGRITSHRQQHAAPVPVRGEVSSSDAARDAGPGSSRAACPAELKLRPYARTAGSRSIPGARVPAVEFTEGGPMQGQTEDVRRHRGRLRHLRRVGRQGAHRARAPRAAARARQERRARQGLHRRPARRRGSTRIAAAAPASWSRPIPVLKRDYPLNEKQPDWWVERAGVAVHRGQALRLVSRLPGGRPLAHLGPAELSPQRPRLRGQRQGGHRRRLADPLRRHRAVVRPRRTPRRHLRLGRRAAAAARWPVPAGDAAQHRRAGARRPAGEAVRRARGGSSRAASPTSRSRSASAAAASSATPAASAAPTAPTSARSRRRCRRRWPPAGSR